MVFFIELIKVKFNCEKFQATAAQTKENIFGGGQRSNN